MLELELVEASAALKRDDEAGPSGEVSFFHGGHSFVAELETCDFHHSSSPPQPDFSPSDFVLCESMLGELEFIPSTIISDSRDPLLSV